MVGDCAKSLQLCLILCNLMDCSPSGSSAHGILQARLLEWVAMPSSREIFLTQGSNPSLSYLLHWQKDSLPVCHLGFVVSVGIPLKFLFHQVYRSKIIRIIKCKKGRWFEVKTQYLFSFERIKVFQGIKIHRWNQEGKSRSEVQLIMCVWATEVGGAACRGFGLHSWFPNQWG